MARREDHCFSFPGRTMMTFACPETQLRVVLSPLALTWVEASEADPEAAALEYFYE